LKDTNEVRVSVVIFKTQSFENIRA